MANTYWQDRQAAALANITSKKEKEVAAQLQKYYLKTMEHTIKRFENTYNKLLATIEDGRQPTPADLYKLDTYWQMQGQLKAELDKLGNKQAQILQKNFLEEFTEIYRGIALKSDLIFSEVSLETAQQMINQIWCADGKSWSARLWGNIDKLQQTLNDGLIECVLAGAKPAELKQLLQTRFGVSFNSANTLVRTEMAHIQTQAAQKRYTDYGVQMVEVWADYDERRCEVCGKLHKKKYPVGATMPIPAHPNCRCTIIPVVEDTKPTEKEVDETQALRNNEEYQAQIKARRAAYHQRKLKEQEKEEYTNKFGKPIEFEKAMLEKPAFSKSIERIKQLSKEYDTRLVSVSRGGQFGGGEYHSMTGELKLATTKEHTAIHEFAHSIVTDKIHKLKIENHTDFWKEIKAIKRKYKKSIIKEDGTIDYDKVISSYSLYNNDDEFIAEAFTHAKIKELGLEMPKNNRGENLYGSDYTYSDEVLKAINKYFKKKKKSN